MARDCFSKPKSGAQRSRYNGKDRQGDAGKGGKVAQIRALMKDISPDERQQLMKEFRSNPLVRIRALMQELPEEEKEQLAEEVVSEASPEEPQENFP